MPSHISDLNHSIRDLINEPRMNAAIRRDHLVFNQLCSGLDLIDDTERAIAAYFELPAHIDIGLRYLALYGLWQAFEQQQNAVTAVSAATNVRLAKRLYGGASVVRRMRDAVAGHTADTREKGAKIRRSHQVPLISLQTRTFDLISHADDGTVTFESVDASEYAATQRELIEEALHMIEDELQGANKEHRLRFKEVQFVGLLNKTDYPVEKVMIGADDPGGPSFIIGNINVLQSAVASFRQELDHRGIGSGTYDGVERCVGTIEYLTGELRSYYEGDASSEIQSDRAADAFSSHLSKKFDELTNMARELDEEYARND